MMRVEEGRYVCVWNGDRSKLQIRDMEHRHHAIVFQGTQATRVHTKADELNAEDKRIREQEGNHGVSGSPTVTSPQ